jgi:hypothetical protein
MKAFVRPGFTKLSGQMSQKKFADARDIEQANFNKASSVA